MEGGIFDIRLHVTGDTPTEVWERAHRACNELRALELPGVDVRYSTMRPAKRSRTFVPTMTPQRKPVATDAQIAEAEAEHRATVSAGRPAVPYRPR